MANKLKKIIVEVEDPFCPLVKLMAKFRVNGEISMIIPYMSNSKHLVILDDGEDIRRFRKLVSSEDMLKVEALDEYSRVLLVTSSKVCELCRLTHNINGVVSKVRVLGGRTRYEIIASRASLLEAQINGTKGIKVVSKLRINNNRISLTLRQLQVLMLAYNLGYFDIPKGSDIRGISEILNLKPSTVDLLLRKIVKKLVESYVNSLSEGSFSS